MEGFIQSAITIVLFLLILGTLVVVHEIGHFVTARLAGIRVLEFGIGFPPRARVIKSDGDTLYTLNWLPIGGFVRLEGEDGDSAEPDSFVRAPLPTRLVVLVAGVTMNLVLAFVIFAGIAWLANPTAALQIGSVQTNSPAAAAGLHPGDAILAVDGRRFDYFEGGLEMTRYLRSRAGEPVVLEIRRADGTLETIDVTLRAPSELGNDRGALGVADLSQVVGTGRIERGPAEAVRIGAERTAGAFGLILLGLGDLIGSIAADPTRPPDVAGPVGIAVTVGEVFWQLGPVFTLYLAGILSANLALVNILPFPPLDGGRMAVILIKSVAGGRVSVTAERLTYLVGFVFLISFLIWITYFDVIRQVSGSGPP